MAADEPIPVFKTVQDAHPIPAIAAREAYVLPLSPHPHTHPPTNQFLSSARYNQLTSHYTSLFGHAPTHIARAPGRVNIIGEHIDYALFGVFPMAVEQDVLIACGPQVVGDGKEVRYGEVKARNLAPKYGPQEFVPTLISKCVLSDVFYSSVEECRG